MEKLQVDVYRANELSESSRKRLMMTGQITLGTL